MSHGHMSPIYSHVSRHQKRLRSWGNAGGMHPHWINFNKHHPVYFGKAGRGHSLLKRNQRFCPTVNLGKLWVLLSEQTWLNVAKNKPGAAPITDLVRLGYYKVLGKVKLPKQPVIVKARFFSRRAEGKIKGICEPVFWCLEATQLIKVFS